jgi:hypothetical protein
MAKVTVRRRREWREPGKGTGVVRCILNAAESAWRNLPLERWHETDAVQVELTDAIKKLKR